MLWSSAAIDEHAGLAVFGTADCNATSAGPFAETVVALKIADGSVRWTFRPPPDTGCDTDFGATANVLDVAGQRAIGVGSKNGTHYTLDARTGALVWGTNVVFGGNAGGFIGSSATDGHRIYGGTALGDFGVPCQPDDPRDQPIQNPSLHAFGLDGSIAWQASNNYTFGATTVADGVVFSGFTGLSADDPPALRAYDAATGALLLELPQAGSVNSSASITRDAVFFGTGDSYDGAGGSVQAYRLP